jgi:stringent starvation protein B
MQALKPYLIRAAYDWIIDNGCTPYLLVNADVEGVVVPRQYVREGKIVLNVHPRAIQGLSIGNQSITFNARFGGKPMQIDIAIRSVLEIYAQENGRGMLFNAADEDEAPPPPETPAPQTSAAKTRPKLTVVK